MEVMAAVALEWTWQGIPEEQELGAEAQVAGTTNMQ